MTMTAKNLPRVGDTFYFYFVDHSLSFDPTGWASLRRFDIARLWCRRTAVI